MITGTLDTGALIAMERKKERGVMLLRAAREDRAQLLAIMPVVAEWWRGRSDVRDRIEKARDGDPVSPGSGPSCGDRARSHSHGA